ncbi:MYXO-CTERM sorting domain-containing protein [Polyangium fumosum]|uniref:MYXO-CTERM sorting domain-containing protein n=1 Tax=Polyangium fumosum TaxID=889272 RepID=UPI003B8301C5
MASGGAGGAGGSGGSPSTPGPTQEGGCTCSAAGDSTSTGMESVALPMAGLLLALARGRRRMRR